MPPRSPFRMVAPLLLLLVVVTVWLTVSPGDDEPSGRPVAGTTTTTSSPPSRRTHTVRAGDDPSSVAARYGLEVDELLELNPRADPRALRAGQRLRLRARD